MSQGRAQRAASNEARASEMLARLGDAGLKRTPQRVAIVRELAGDLTHPTAQELYERLRPSMPTMSFATVYNTLDALARARLIAPRALSPGATRFDPNVRPHGHAVCDRCGAVADVPAQGDGEATPELGSDLPRGFTVHAVERVFCGICGACAAVDPGARPS